MEKTLCYSELSGHTARPDIKKSKSHALFSLLNPWSNEGCFFRYTLPRQRRWQCSALFRANCCQSVRGAMQAARRHASAASIQRPLTSRITARLPARCQRQT